MAYQLSYSFSAAPSLSLEAVIRDTTGAAVGSPVTTGFREEASSGWYVWRGSIPDGHTGSIVFRTQTTNVVYAVFAINPQEGENTDMKMSSGINLNLSQTVPISDLTTKTNQTVGDCLSAARADGAGKWTIVGNLFTVYGPDNSIVMQLKLDDPTAPTSRTPNTA